jgi:hypothetical protein
LCRSRGRRLPKPNRGACEEASLLRIWARRVVEGLRASTPPKESTFFSCTVLLNIDAVLTIAFQGQNQRPPGVSYWKLQYPSRRTGRGSFSFISPRILTTGSSSCEERGRPCTLNLLGQQVTFHDPSLSPSTSKQTHTHTQARIPPDYAFTLFTDSRNTTRHPTSPLRSLH